MKYYCQYCGKDYKDVFTLTRCKCPGHPDGHLNIAKKKYLENERIGRD